MKIALHDKLLNIQFDYFFLNDNYDHIIIQEKRKKVVLAGISYNTNAYSKFEKIKIEFDLLNDVLNEKINVKSLQSSNFIAFVCKQMKIDFQTFIQKLEDWRSNKHPNNHLITYWLNYALSNNIYSHNFNYKDNQLSALSSMHADKLIGDMHKKQICLLMENISTMLMLLLHMPKFISNDELEYFAIYKDVQNNSPKKVKFSLYLKRLKLNQEVINKLMNKKYFHENNVEQRFKRLFIKSSATKNYQAQRKRKGSDLFSDIVIDLNYKQSNSFIKPIGMVYSAVNTQTTVSQQF